MWPVGECIMKWIWLTFTTLWANSADDKLITFSKKTEFVISCKLSSLEIICMKMSNLFFGTYMYQKKILLNAVCCNFTQSAKRSVFFSFLFYIISPYLFYLMDRGWSGGAKVLCILHHWGVQLILAYSWARPAVLVVGKDRGGNVFISSVSSLSFLFLFLPCPSLSSPPLLSLLSLFSLSLGDDTKWPSRVDVSLNPNTINT